jgi:hypothetical protein
MYLVRTTTTRDPETTKMTTATAKKTTRQTTANNPFLAECKRLFNKPTYKQVLDLTNAEGEPAAREWLLKNVVRSLDF